MVAVVAGERVEEDGNRLQDEHVEIGGDDEHAPGSRAQPAARIGEERVHEHREDEIRREHTHRVRSRTVRVVQHADQRREADRAEQQAKARILRQPQREHARAHERQTDDRGEQ